MIHIRRNRFTQLNLNSRTDYGFITEPSDEELCG